MAWKCYKKGKNSFFWTKTGSRLSRFSTLPRFRDSCKEFCILPSMPGSCMIVAIVLLPIYGPFQMTLFQFPDGSFGNHWSRSSFMSVWSGSSFQIYVGRFPNYSILKNPFCIGKCPPYLSDNNNNMRSVWHISSPCLSTQGLQCAHWVKYRLWREHLNKAYVLA